VAEIRGATWADLDAVFELLAARSRAAFGISEQPLHSVRQRWELPGFEVGRDNWVAVADGRVVGYAEVESTQDLVHAAVDPEVGNALFARAEARARDRGFDNLSCTVVPEDEPLHALVTRNGFTKEREVWRMWRMLDGDLPEPVWPDGVSVRGYEDADAPRVHAALDESYAGWDREYVAREHDDWVAFMTAHDEFDPGLWFLAERGDELVGCALHWQESRGDGWVKDIVVRESERGRGLGTALLQHGFRAYAERGVARVGLKVDSTNPTGAPRLYARTGFVTDRRYGVWFKQL
jgi:mycothiol synthase